MTFTNNSIHTSVVKDLRPMAVGLFFYLIKYKKYVILYVAEYLDVRAKYAYAFLRVN